MPIGELTDSDFYKEAVDSPMPSVILITRGGLNNCSIFKLFEDLSLEYENCVKFFFLDADKSTICKDLGIDIFPAVVYFRETMEIERQYRVMERSEIEAILKKLCKR